MGRKRLNKTYQQILEENRIRSKKYYELHRERIKKSSMERYNSLKENYVKKINNK
jgi:hypothetical protein